MAAQGRRNPFADILNAGRKVVFSRTLKTADWAGAFPNTVRIAQMNVSLRPLEDGDLDAIYQLRWAPKEILTRR